MGRKSNTGTLNVIPFAVFVILVLIGIYVRVYKLDYHSFWTDEYYHVFPAISLLKTGSPNMPSGIKMDRALPFTRLVSWSFNFWGINEITARLPSALFSVLTLVVVGIFSWRILGREAALFILLLFTLEHNFVKWARLSRMYAPLQFFNVLSFFLLYTILFGNIKGRYKRPLFIYSGLIIIWLLVCWLGTKIHILFLLPLGSTLIAFIIAEGIILIKKKDRDIRILIIFFLFILLTLGLIWRISDLGWFAIKAGPESGQAAIFHFLATPDLNVVEFFWETGQIILILNIIYLVRIWKNRFTLICLLVFLQGLGFFVFISSYQNSNYSMVFQDFYFLMAGYILYCFFTDIKKWLTKLSLKSAYKVASLCVIFAVILLNNPSIKDFVKAPLTHYREINTPDFRAAGKFLADRVKDDHCVVTTLVTAIQYYLPQADNLFLLRQKHFHRFAPGVIKRKDRLIEPDCGRLIISSLSKLKALSKRCPTIWLVLDESKFSSHVTADVKAFIATHAVPVFIADEISIFKLARPVQ